MGNLLLTITVLITVFSLNGQSYFSFPKDTANWNCLYWHQWHPDFYDLTNYQYIQQGDTIIKGKNYLKIFYNETDSPSPSHFIGGIREDSLKQIFFFPTSIHLNTIGGHSFPNDTAEHLLYSFNNLQVGDTLAINTNYTDIIVESIDSVLLGTTFRKRYEIQNVRFLFGPEYWIEGIGSTKDLLSPFTYEFEWRYYTLCYTDSTTYYINSPNGEDSCHYQVPMSINDLEISKKFKVFPNPTSEYITIHSEVNLKKINIYNSFGQLLIHENATKPEIKINVQNLNSGIYIVELINSKGRIYTKIIKE